MTNDPKSGEATVPEDLQERYNKACAVVRESEGIDFGDRPTAAVIMFWSQSVKQLIERIAKAESELADERVAFNHANEVNGRLESDLVSLRTRNEQLEAELADERLAFNHAQEVVGKLEDELARMREKYAHQENQELCLGFDGGCDGDLTATPHEENCPAYAKDKELNPHLYVAPPREGESR